MLLFNVTDPVRIGSLLMRSISQGKALTLKARIQSTKCNYKCGAERENKECQFEGRNQQRNQPTVQPNVDRFSRSLMGITFVSQLCNNFVLVRSQKSHSQPVKSLARYHFLGLTPYCGNYVLGPRTIPLISNILAVIRRWSSVVIDAIFSSPHQMTLSSKYRFSHFGLRFPA